MFVLLTGLRIRMFRTVKRASGNVAIILLSGKVAVPKCHASLKLIAFENEEGIVHNLVQGKEIAVGSVDRKWDDWRPEC